MTTDTTDTTNKRRRHSTDPSPSASYISDKPLKKLIFDLESDTTVMDNKNQNNQNKIAMGSDTLPTDKHNSLFTDDDVQRLARAVKHLMFDDLRKELRNDMKMYIDSATAPLYLEIEKLKLENCQLQRSSVEIPKINSKLDDLEQHSRKSCIRIYGVPQSNDENTTDIVCDIANKLNVTLENKDISVSHRLPSEKGPKSIIARFTHAHKRIELLKATKNIPTTPELKGIGISQDLTKNRSKVAYLARQAVKQHKIKSTSVWDGKIFITDNEGNRKIITSECELNDMITNEMPLHNSNTNSASDMHANSFPQYTGMMQIRSPGSPFMVQQRIPFMPHQMSSFPPQISSYPPHMFNQSSMTGPQMMPQMSFPSNT